MMFPPLTNLVHQPPGKEKSRGRSHADRREPEIEWSPFSLPAQEDQNTRSDRERVHHGAQPREAEIEHRYERGQDEPGREQQHSEVSRQCHW